MKRAPPRLATWLLKHLYCGPEYEAVLGDLVERYGCGKSFVWYWKQVVATIAASSVSNLGRYARIGFCIGGVNGGVSILENVALHGPHGMGHFNAVSIVLPSLMICFVLRKVGRAGKSIRGVLLAACIAGLVFSALLAGFSAWRFEFSPEWLWNSIPKFAVFDFFFMFFLVLAPGGAAVRRSPRNQTGLGR